jgi:sulfite reductase alpha subunit-like flavoprotein
MGSMVGSMVRAQEAALARDVEALKREMIAITGGIQHFATKTFMALNPNPYSATFVDPVVWAKTVAPFAVPIAEGTVGPSGVGAPAFHMLDTFFDRVDYDTHLGHEMLQMRSWYPKHWRAFFDAVSEVSVAAFVEQSDDPVLNGIYKEAALSYAGDGGFLSQHMIKAYGYLDIAFKVGRSVTIGGFSGSFSDRVWDLAVDELTNSQVERERTLPRPGHRTSIKSVELINPSGDEDTWVKRVVFDVSNTGMRYAPGDRCAVLPDNSDALVAKTLDALRATGDEEVTLTAEWRKAIDLRASHEGATSLPLRTLLRFGRIRPVDREVAKTLYFASHNGRLRRIIESRGEDQWELWDLLNMLTEAGFDSKRLLKVHPGEREHICRVVPMESFRMYSISSTMDRSSLAGADELSLTIGRLKYTTADTEVSQHQSRQGTASHFLGDEVPAADDRRLNVSLRVVHPPRFSLPSDPSTPIVMFGGGTGIAPFRSFIHERVAQAGGGENWLFLGSRERSDFYYESEFAPMVAAGRLQVRAAFSRDPVELRFDTTSEGTGFSFEPGEKKYIGDEILRDDNAEMLWQMLRKKEDGGAGAHFYVCGRTGFASSVMDAIEKVMDRFYEGPEDQRGLTTSTALYKLLGEERYMQDIFSTYTGSHLDTATTHTASEVVLHNNPVDGYWMVIDGRVYDMNKFGHLHPGGFKIIQAYAGMDGTAAYQKVLHHVNPEINSMLGMYEIGVVRRLHFGRQWGTVIAPDGLRSMLLSDAYRTWIRFLYSVTEMENAFQQDCAIKDQTIIGTDDPGSFPPIKLQYLLEAHDRFTANYVAGTTGDTLDDLWAVTSGFCSPKSDVRRIHNEIAEIQQSREADTVSRFSREIQRRIDDIVMRGAEESDPTVRLVKEYCALLHAEDSRYLNEVKMALRSGVMVFEEFESDAAQLGSEQLMAAVQSLPGILSSYHARLLSGVLSLWLTHPT